MVLQKKFLTFVKVTLSPSTIALDWNSQSVFHTTPSRGFLGKTLTTQIIRHKIKIPIKDIRIIDQILPRMSMPKTSRNSPPIPDS